MEPEIQGIGIISLIMGLTELAKQMGVPNRFLPLLNLVLGLIGGFIIQRETIPAIIMGLMMGTSAAGIYRSAKVTMMGR
jgi:ribose/xylose/arabinose/galactoside ABC-type transport system permease subunit